MPTIQMSLLVSNKQNMTRSCRGECRRTTRNVLSFSPTYRLGRRFKLHWRSVEIHCILRNALGSGWGRYTAGQVTVVAGIDHGVSMCWRFCRIDESIWDRNKCQYSLLLTRIAAVLPGTRTVLHPWQRVRLTEGSLRKSALQNVGNLRSQSTYIFTVVFLPTIFIVSMYVRERSPAVCLFDSPGSGGGAMLLRYTLDWYRKFRR